MNNGISRDKQETASNRQKEFDRFLADLDEESDRGAVLSAAAHFELHVERIVSARLGRSSIAKQLIKASGPLSSFQAKSDLCLCLEFINEYEHKALALIGRIRNAFAHELLIDFGQQSIRDRSIELAKHMLKGDIEASTLAGLISKGPRACFTCCAFILSDRLKLRDLLILEMRETLVFDFATMNREIEEILERSDR